MRSDTPAPAISRAYSELDGDVDVVQTPYDSVSSTRGYGDSGYRLQVVEHECPNCGFDRMFRHYRVNEEFPDHLKYWCLSPACQHYVGEEFSYAGPTQARSPTEHDVAGD